MSIRGEADADQREVLFQRVIEPYIETRLFRDLNDPEVNHLFWSLMTDIIADGWRRPDEGVS